MATIGTFTRNVNGYAGTIETLTLKIKAKFIAAESKSGKGPDFHIVAGNGECGAAWKKRSDKGNDYLSVLLDDPAFPATIRASLVGTNIEGEYALLWSRPRAR